MRARLSVFILFQELLEVPEPTQYPQIAESLLMKEPFDKLWNTAVRFQERYDTWTKGPILGLNAEEVAEEVQIVLAMTKLNRVEFLDLLSTSHCVIC